VRPDPEARDRRGPARVHRGGPPYTRRFGHDREVAGKDA
jgi:hypothetical protein